jgi:hypothetical protein
MWGHSKKLPPANAPPELAQLFYEETLNLLNVSLLFRLMYPYCKEHEAESFSLAALIPDVLLKNIIASEE